MLRITNDKLSPIDRAFTVIYQGQGSKDNKKTIAKIALKQLELTKMPQQKVLRHFFIIHLAISLTIYYYYLED